MEIGDRVKVKVEVVTWYPIESTAKWGVQGKFSIKMNDGKQDYVWEYNTNRNTPLNPLLSADRGQKFSIAGTIKKFTSDGILLKNVRILDIL